MLFIDISSYRLYNLIVMPKTKNEYHELHVIAIAADQSPGQSGNGERIQSAGSKIADLLEPASLAVASANENEALSTARQINQALGASALSDKVAKFSWLEAGSIKNEGAKQWRSNFEVFSALALIKDKQRGQEHNLGLVLVTHEDVVKQLPGVFGKAGYQNKTNVGYGAVNYLLIKSSEGGNFR